ncbi:MAG: hypothetical protein IKK88_06010, partial [Oscillospiraceae bacterium]|nr:hypothetical protein [Oscillospiraceae bacterium]
MKKHKKIIALVMTLAICSGTAKYMINGDFTGRSGYNVSAVTNDVEINENNFPDEKFRNIVSG